MTHRTLQAAPLLDVAAAHGEGITWDPVGGRLLFVDIPAGRVFEHDPRAGGTTVHDLDRDVSFVHPAADGRLAVGVREGVAVLARDGALRPLVRPLLDRPELRMNDGNVDPRGRLFIGSMAYDVTAGAAALYRLDLKGRLTTALTGVTISNGIDWSPDGSLLYFIDSTTRRVDVFDYDLDSGTMANRRPFAGVDEEQGLPDGLTVDAQGGVWIALFGGGQVRRFTPDGRLDQVVDVPGARLVTSCCFGGPALDRLYITTSTENLGPGQLRAQPGAGQIYQAVPGHRGRPPTPFPVPAMTGAGS